MVFIKIKIVAHQDIMLLVNTVLNAINQKIGILSLKNVSLAQVDIYGIKTFIYVIVALLQDKLWEINVFVRLEKRGRVAIVYVLLEQNNQIVFHVLLQDFGIKINVYVQQI